MSEAPHSPWICHICNLKSTATEGRACSLCYKIACDAHLQNTTVYNRESGLYEPQLVCMACAAASLH